MFLSWQHTVTGFLQLTPDPHCLPHHVPSGQLWRLPAQHPSVLLATALCLFFGSRLLIAGHVEEESRCPGSHSG